MAAGTLAVACLAGAPAAWAADSTVVYDGIGYRYTGTPGNDQVDVRTEGSRITFVLYGGTFADPASGSGCTKESAYVLHCTPSYYVDHVRFDLLAGDDGLTVDGAFAHRVEANGAAGTDTLNGGPLADLLQGGDDRDSLAGGDGADRLVGGPGSDHLTPGAGSDAVAGGDGFDRVSYQDRAAAVTVTLDDRSDDGEAGEGDNVHADVEDISGGAGDDVLTGTGGNNEIFGGRGNDRIDGQGGGDALYGDSGADTVAARDGDVDRVDCGIDDDAATVDASDGVDGCEALDASDALVRDADGDGVDKPADCDDRRGDVHPGAAEVPENGVDENCDGADGVIADRDGDGVNRGDDCDDGDPAVRPGAAEVAGNAVDEDCDGVANPVVRVKSGVRIGYRATRAGTRLSLLAVADLVAGTRVEVRCRGRGCPFKVRTRTSPKARDALALTGLLRKALLRPGTRVTLIITRPGAIGRHLEYRMRAAKPPSLRERCVDVDRKVVKC